MSKGWPDRLFAVYAERLRSGKTLTGSEMADVAGLLIAREVAPGGPYRNQSGAVTVEFNRQVLDVMNRVGVRLPNLQRYVGLNEEPEAPQPVSGYRFELAYANALRLITALPAPLQQGSQVILKRIQRADRTGEISQLTRWFAASLKTTESLDASMIRTLATANLFTWMAYTLYDDLLDDDGTAAVLPVANAAHRIALHAYQSVNRSAGIDYGAVFTTMDAANASEMADYRVVVNDSGLHLDSVPTYDSLTPLADRSRAHVLGPLIVADMIGLNQRRLTRALDNYLIARQLSDDLHDWTDDLVAGRMTPVVVRLFKDGNVTPGHYEVAPLITRLRRTFWESTLIECSHAALDRIIRADADFTRFMDTDSPFIRHVSTPIRRSLEQGLERHRNDKQFLKSYSATTTPFSMSDR